MREVAEYWPDWSAADLFGSPNREDDLPLLAGDTFKAACGELAVALILNGAVIDYTPHLADRLRPAIVAAGWQADGAPPSREHVS